MGQISLTLRVTLELVDLTEELKKVEFKVFSSAANMTNGRVAALKIPGGSELSRSEIDAYTEFVKDLWRQRLSLY